MSWHTEVYERPTSDESYDETLRSIGLWYHVMGQLRFAELIGNEVVVKPQTVINAMELKFGDVSCECGHRNCDGLAGHYGWDGKRYYKGNWF